MNDESNVSYIAFESSMAREERHNKRLVLVIVTILICWALSTCGIIAGFLWYISLPVEETTITQDSDNASDNYIVGGDYHGSETDLP